MTVWGKRGEALSKILSKGSSIFVEGSIRTSSYEKDGEKRYRTEVVANNIILAGGRRGAGEGRGDYDGPSSSGGGGGGESRGGGGGGRAPAKPASQAPAEPEYGGPGFDVDDEIPF